MISTVSGRVAALRLDAAVVEVGGVGLLVHATPGTLAGLRVGEPTTLATSLVVREDALTLYGFADDDERGVFETVQTVSGVGPRLALAMLAVHPPDALRRAVASEDLKTLEQVPGIGRKGAQRIVLELKDKLGVAARVGGGPDAATTTAAGALGGLPGGWQSQVHEALVGLGWSAKDADRAVSAVAPDAGSDDAPDVAALLRAALRNLAP